MFNKNKIEIKINGMKCSHCAKKVEENLKKIENIKNVKVDLCKGTVTISFKNENILLKEIEKTINNLGYEYKGII